MTYSASEGKKKSPNLNGILQICQKEANTEYNDGIRKIDFNWSI